MTKSASDWWRKPAAIHKLWNNPAAAPPEQVAAQKAKIRAWEAEYRYASKEQKAALKRDNEEYAARQRGYHIT